MKKNYRKLFPMLNNQIVYLDNAALTQKPISVINAGSQFYKKYAISTRTSDSKLGIIVQQKVDLVRQKVANLLNGSPNEIIFTSGTTQSLNLFSLMAKQLLNVGDEILLSYYNHSSNIIPWLEIAKELKLQVKFSKNLVADINHKTKIIAYSQVTNNIDQHFDSDSIYQKAKQFNAIVVNDAAQAIAHEKVSFANSDIIAFSTNKLYGPTGLGILAIKQDILQSINPVIFGGGSVEKMIDVNSWCKKQTIEAFEPGTLNLAAIWQFEQALNLIDEITIDEIQKINLELANYLYDRLLTVKGIEIFSQKGDFITLFRIKNYAPQDIASYLGHKDIYVRSGNFCSKALSFAELENDYVRVSLAFYNNKNDINKLVKALKEGGDFLSFI
ncbi:aminotransferase class V-fold PLP-dependent enzyme [Mesomycoplasma lagogenitalium]|uniref:Aminotransferase class V-fold PLP-dependent enzyme n=1 Tax=Mesomycoplasma lagogenitalium TaxID=171286 RepID=A0ABY8LSN3_9BACT|nr:aminotransferase class V-fold PLP-dependent enzyme [Mesomycoplasma lagogenitalium]WGI36274.1 aminotransferase class V-fold PLP-dependent enzyme [Mesomycoplasma lagogenitalium]